MTPAFAELVERHVVDPETHAAITTWLGTVAYEATTEEAAAFWLTLRREVAEPSPVGAVADTFVMLERALEPHDIAAIAAFSFAAAHTEPAWAADVTLAGVVELRAAVQLAAEVDQAVGA